MRAHEMKIPDMNATEKRPKALVLAALIVCMLFSGCVGKEVNALSETTVNIVSFEEDQFSVVAVKQGTAAEEIGLPDVLTANIAVAQELAETNEQTGEDMVPTQTPISTQQCDVPVCWKCENYNPNIVGKYDFTANLENGYTYSGEMSSVTVNVEAAPEEEPIIPAEPDVILEEGAQADGAEPTAEPIKPADPLVISCFTNEPVSIEVERGTAIENIPLPETLPAQNESGEAIEVPVTWTNAAESESDSDDYAIGSLCGYGPWIFVATVDDSYIWAGEPVKATVSIPDCNQIQDFCGITSDGLLMRFVIFEGESVSLSTEVGAFMADGGYKNIPVSWSGSYDTETTGTYVLTMHTEGGYTGCAATAEIVVVSNCDN